MKPSVAVTLISNEQCSIDELASAWLLLEARSNASFFLSWTWIGKWLKQLSMPYYVLKATLDDEIVGLSIIVKNTRYMFGFLPVQQWWINRSGDEAFDQCWIEENDFLVDSTNTVGIKEAMVEFLKKNNQWQEIILGMSHDEAITRFTKVANSQMTLVDDKGYGVDFSQLEKTYELDVLSRNSRQKIRQSERLLSLQGALSFQVSNQTELKLEQLEYIAQLHIQRWRETLTPSGFTNVHFREMMQALLTDEHCEILCLALNEKPIGYLVNIRYGNKVYFYLSALASYDNPKIKVGMLIQKKAIEYYQQQGVVYYDFLAGDLRYKASLTNDSYAQRMIRFYNNTWLYQLENQMKTIKNKILN